MKKKWLYIRRGLFLSPVHRAAIGQAVWTYLYMVDRTDWDTGIVPDWVDQDEADKLRMNLRTLRSHRKLLEKHGYITCVQKQHNQEIILHNWRNPTVRGHDPEPVNVVEGDIEMGTLGVEGDIKRGTLGVEGAPEGDINLVTPTYKPHTSDDQQPTWDERKAAARKRKADQQASKGDVFDLLTNVQPVEQRITEMRARVEKALKKNLTRQWDNQNSPWYRFDQELIRKEDAREGTIEMFSKWWFSQDEWTVTRLTKSLKPAKIEENWPEAMENFTGMDVTQEVYKEKEAEYVAAPKK